MGTTFKDIVKDCFRPLTWFYTFFKWLFRWQKKVNRSKTTKKFRGFKEYYDLEEKKKGIKRSESDFLLLFILNVKESPFENDCDMAEANKFRHEQNVFFPDERRKS